MEKSTHKVSSAQMHQQLALALDDLSILAGRKAKPSDASWRDVAGTCATNFEIFAHMLHQAQKGNHESILVFPDLHKGFTGQFRAILRACEKAQVAYEVFVPVKQSYHAGLTDDATFLAARKVHEVAKAEYEKAFTEASDILVSDMVGRP